ncbi:hypothetical protein ABG768_000587 [Culter alburnus]|uniref:Uncharacterized protein n=1 Tax=Culter alburnus TaxID=194366 RepID=A0AAW2BA52_CULAL
MGSEEKLYTQTLYTHRRLNAANWQSSWKTKRQEKKNINTDDCIIFLQGPGQAKTVLSTQSKHSSQTQDYTLDFRVLQHVMLDIYCF